jgi:hypothetical protein
MPSDNLPGAGEIARFLKSSQVKGVTVTCGNVTVTVSPQLEIESVQLGGPGVAADHRTALERDIRDAIARAMRDVVIASARSLDGLQDLPEMRSMRDALEKELGRRNGNTKAG